MATPSAGGNVFESSLGRGECWYSISSEAKFRPELEACLGPVAVVDVRRSTVDEPVSVSKR